MQSYLFLLNETTNILSSCYYLFNIIIRTSTYLYLQGSFKIDRMAKSSLSIFKVGSGISNTWQTPKICIWYYHAHTTFIDVLCDNVPFKNDVVVF